MRAHKTQKSSYFSILNSFVSSPKPHHLSFGGSGKKEEEEEKKVHLCGR